MCNAWNHPPDCTCDWGGDGHLGVSTEALVTHRVGRFCWQHSGEDFCRPTRCPICGESVFFVRHNGGSVWFDELGEPWPKHGCFADDRYALKLRHMLTEKYPSNSHQTFGVVIETETIRPGESGRIVVRCSDGTLINKSFSTEHELSDLLGDLVVVISTNGGTRIRLIEAPVQKRTLEGSPNAANRVTYAERRRAGLRRYPVVITTTSDDYREERLTRIVGVILRKFPESKPRLENGNRIRVLLWADEAKWLRETMRGNYRIQM